MRDRALLVKLFYKNYDCAPAALKKFWSFKGMKKGFDSMSAKNLKKMIKKFEIKGFFFLNRAKGGNKLR